MTAPFGRPTLLVASMQKPVAKALGRFVDLFRGEHLIHAFTDENVIQMRCAEDLHTRLDEMDRHELFDTVCVVDLTQNNNISWNITRSEAGVRPSELVLRYPGVYWIFLVNRAPALIESNVMKELHFVELDDLAILINLLHRHAEGFRSWFDPTGLRRAIRGEERPYDNGVALDDEVDFAVLNGYVLYKNNYATFTISTLSEMENVLKDGNIDVSVAMEDVELNFSDLEDKYKPLLFTSTKKGKERNITKVLDNRRAIYTALKDARRVFVSSVSDIPITRLQDSFVTKPYGGMYAEELAFLGEGIEENSYKEHKKNLPSTDGHSVCNSRAQQVAAGLIERAKKEANNVCTTEAAIHVALMAIDARRLLHGECLSLSLEALSLQHKMEVTAECTFIGTASQLAVKERFRSLNATIKKMIGKKKYGSQQINNALVEIADDIRKTYAEYDQFVEEEEAIIKLRTYEWRLKYWSRQPKNRTRRIISNILFFPKLVLAGIPELYFNHVISRLWKMGLWVSIWIVMFACIYAGFGIESINIEGIDSHKEAKFLDWLLHSIAHFIAPGSGILTDMTLGSPLIDKLIETEGNSNTFHKYWYTVLSEMLLGFIHLGIFISYLFQKISRR